jgi:pyruvate dehydrogenase E2 component (dihydrolipoamide acetyltransferase)
MATPLRMPDLGTVEGDVTLVRWLKAEGDTVALGEPLFEVETDKGVSEVEAAIAGVLLRKVAAEGAKAGPGDTIALIRRPGEPEESTEAAGTVAAQMPPSTAEMPRGTVAAVVPVIRALAEKWGVDLTTISATGPGGRVTREDVLRAKAGGAAAASAPRGPAASVAAAPGGIAAGAAPLSLSHGQAIVARKVSQSYREKPVYRVNALVDMSKAIAIREKGKAGGTAISWDALFVKTASIAITEMPLFRRYFKGDNETSRGTMAAEMPRSAVAVLSEHAAADVAVAVGIEDELYIPAVRGAAGKSVAAVSREIEALAKKAESRALQPADVEGSCFLVSNLGMFPVDSFDAIIYPDHAAALAVGATTPTPVSDGRNIWIAPMARLSLSVDHRLINGKTAARFCARVKQILENGDL